MKSFKILSVFLALLVNVVFGSAIGYAMAPSGASPAVLNLFMGGGALSLTAIAVATSFITLPSGIRAGVYVEVWTGELVKQFTHVEQGTFMDGVSDYSRYVNNAVIHLVDVGADPGVLIDNTTYPLDIENLTDGDIAITLHKFETKATRVTDDELYALSYDKIASVKERHGNKMGESRLDMALHAFAPATNTADTPVLLTTGDDDGTGRRRLVRKDIIDLKAKLDKLKVPKAGRRLVLCNDHVNDLLLLDQKFSDQYYNYQSGAISKIHGFEVFEFVNCPLFSQARAKRSFGAVPVAGDYEASVFFYVPNMFKAMGETKMYYSEAKTDPLNKQNLVSFTNRFVALPKKAAKSVAAIVSATV